MFMIEKRIEGYGLYSGQHDAIYGEEVLQAGKRSTARQTRRDNVKNEEYSDAYVREAV